MEAALDEGASVIGRIDPANIDGDPKGHLGTIFDIANRKSAKIDIHLHEAGELGLFELYPHEPGNGDIARRCGLRCKSPTTVPVACHAVAQGIIRQKSASAAARFA